MIIKKVLNTNAVLAYPQEKGGRDILVLGSGVGFRKRNGESIDEEKVEKTFSLQSESTQSRFMKLLDAIPERYFVVAEQIIDYAHASFPETKFNESIHLSLVDHIYNAIDNALKGIQVPNTALNDIRSFYRQEYAIGQFGLQTIYENFGQKLADDEAGFIAMHFVMARQDDSRQDLVRMLNLVHEIDDLIRQELSVPVDESSVAYYRYMTHIKFFAERVMKNSHYPEENTSRVMEMMVKNFPQEYEAARKVCAYVEEKYGYHAGSQEEIYLAVHLANLSDPKK